MKENMTFVAVDADDIGFSIGNAVLSDNVDQLSSLSENINSGIQIFSQWAEYNGGKVISSGSDEAIFQVPVNSIDDLEKLKEEYQNKTGFTICIGIGDSVSNAAKALIYAKMNGKNQITDYSPEIERVMKESISGDLSEQTSENKIEGGVGDDTDKEDLPQDELEAGTEHEKEHTDDEEIAEEIATDHLTEDDDYYSDLEEMEEENEEEDEETEEIKVPADQVDGDYGSEEMEEAQPEHEKEMSEEEEFIHDAEENREDELDDDIIEADEEEEYLEEEPSEDEALEEMVEEDAEEDIDLDGRPDEMEEHGEIDPAVDDLDQDGDVEHEEAMAAEAGADEEYEDESDYGDEIDEDPELEAAIAEEMGAEEEMPQEEMMDEAPIEESGAEEPLDHEDLKSVIYESLNIFRENREYLNAMGQENPELYSSLIHTLQAMIEMAKELGYGDVSEELAAEEPEMEDDMLSDEDEVMQMPEDDEEEMEDYEKSEVYVRLIDKMKKAFDLHKADPQTMEEVKEAIKKKKEQNKKGGNKKVSKKKKSAANKPKIPGKKNKKSADDKGDNDGSFCAKSHKKMRAAGKDCRSNEDKNSPLCSARKKFNCRGKNEEKGPVIEKSEKLAKFLKKKELEIKSGNKGRQGTGTKQTTKKVHKEHAPVGSENLRNKVKVQDSESGKEKWIDGSAGLAMGPDGNPMAAEGQSPMKGKKPKPSKVPKTDKV